MTSFLTRFTAAAVVAGATVLGGASAAQADTELQLDLNTITATFNGVDSDPFSTSATGTVNLTTNSTSSLADVLINGAEQNIAPGLLKSLTGVITLVDGVVTGGSFSVEAWDDLTKAGFNKFTAEIVGNVEGSKVNHQPGQGFSIAGLIFNGWFDTPFFAGVDVSPWFDNSPISGAFINFAFKPDANGVDDKANLDIFATVPSPAAAAAGLPLLGLLGAGYVIRRRRQNV